MKQALLLKDFSEARRLHECAKFRSGKTPTRQRAEFWNGAIPWFSAKDLKAFRLDDSKEHISELAVSNGAPISNPGDVLILVRGMTLLKDVPIGLLTRDASFNQDIKALTPVDNVNGEYLAYMLAASRQRLMSMVEKAGHGTGRLAIERISALPIWIPNFEIQNYIQSKLRLIDELLEYLQILIHLKVHYRQGLVQQLLTGQKRFPEFNEKQWNEMTLGELFAERNERNRPDLPLLSVTNDRGIIPRDELQKRDTSNPDKSKYKRVAVGDIAYNTMRMWQGVSALSDLEGIVSPAYTVAIPTSRIEGRFAKHLFKFPQVVHLFRRHSQGLVDDTLNLKFNRFSKIKVRLPKSTHEQSRIADVLDQCDEELAILENLKWLYENYKKGLLSRLLSGEMELPTP